MAKIQISSSIIIFLCILALGQQLATSKTCKVHMGCTPSDFDCWLHCKQKYEGGHGGCTNKDALMSSRLAFLLNDDSESGKYCCHCLCKFESKGNKPCPKSSPPGAEGPSHH